MQRLDNQEAEKHVKACIYGPPGTGKTSFGVSSPKPLIAITERQAMVHINEAVSRTGVPMPQVFFMETADDLRNLVRSLHGDQSKPFKILEKHGNEKICVHEGEWPETLVLDSATDACRLLVEEIRRQAPPQRGKDGLPVDSQRFWGVLIDRASTMITAIRDLPVHAVFLALADDRETGDEDNKVRSLKPMMASRGISLTLAAAVNVVGYTYRKTKRGAPGEEHRLEYGVMTTGPEYMLTKPFRPLRDVEVPNFGYWVRVVQGNENNVQPAPEPSQELSGGEVGHEDRPLAADTKGEETKTEEPTAAAEAPSSDTRPARKRRAG